MNDKLYTFEEALDIAKNNSVIMARIIDCDGFDICKKWFMFDDEGNIKSRVFWYNNYPGGLTLDDIFSNKHTDCNFDDTDYKCDNWIIEENLLK